MLEGILGAAAVILGLCLLWRFLCKYYCIPWPYWLAFWLENPYMIVFCPPHRLLRLGRLESSDSVLEIGCGAGRVLIPAALRVAPQRVVGVDLQVGMLAQLEKRAHRLRVKNLDWYKFDLRADPLPEGPFDKIFIITVLGEIPRFWEYLPKLKAAMHAETIISVTEVLPDPCYIPCAKLKDIFTNAGFAVQGEWHNLVSYTVNFELRRGDLLAD